MADTNWTGDSGNWNDNAEWSANAPNSTTNAVFNASSFSTTGLTVTANASCSCANMDWSAATNAPTLTVNSNISVYGNVVLLATQTVGGNGSTYLMLAVAAAGTQQVTTNGVSIGSRAIWQNGTGTVQLQDALACSYAGTAILLTQGVLQTNGKALTLSAGSFNLTGTTTRTFDITGSTVTYAGTWNLTDKTNFTLTTNASSKLVWTGTAAATFIGGGLTTYPELNHNGTAALTISGSNTFTKLTMTATKEETIKFTDGTTQTVTSATFDGDIDHRHTLTGSSTAGWTLSCAGAITADYVKISYCTFTGGGTFVAGPHAIDGGGNTGITFTGTAEDLGMKLGGLGTRDRIWS